MIVGKEPNVLAETPGVVSSDARGEQTPDTGDVGVVCLLVGYRPCEGEPS